MPSVQTVPYPLVDGNRQEFASIEMLIGPTVFYAVGINYKSPLKPVGVWANHPQKLGSTLGREEPEADLEMYLAEAYSLVQTLGPGYKQTRFKITVNYQAQGMPLITDVLLGCRIIDFEASQAAGPEPLKRKIPLDVLRVLPFNVEPLVSPLKGVAQ